MVFIFRSNRKRNNESMCLCLLSYLRCFERLTTKKIIKTQHSTLFLNFSQDAILSNVENLRKMLGAREDTGCRMERRTCRMGWSDAERSDADMLKRNLYSAFYEIVTFSNEARRTGWFYEKEHSILDLITKCFRLEYVEVIKSNEQTLGHHPCNTAFKGITCHANSGKEKNQVYIFCSCLRCDDAFPRY